MSPLVEEAFSDKRFAKLKMTPHTFQCYLGLWPAININPPKEVHFPLPPLARIIPLLVSYWNVLKGGGDTITKLDDICQERIGIRSEVLVASARTLLNIGVVLHRCIQMCSSKRLSEYPTLYHYRNAASKRFTMKQSLKKLTDILLGWAHGTAHGTMSEADTPPLELANFCPSPAVPEPSPRRSARTVPPTPDIRLPCVAGITGKTPGEGKSVLKPHAEFVERCVNCDGTFPSIKFDPTKKEQRMGCSVCERRTTHFCWKCRRYLCNEPPKNGKDRSGKKYPRTFFVKVPKLKTDGSIQRSPDDKVVFQTEYGVLSCYVIAHQVQWKKMYENKQAAGVASAGSSGASSSNTKRGRTT